MGQPTILHVKLEGAVRVHVAVDEGAERPEVLFAHAVHPRRLAEDLLKHEGIDVDKANLKEVKAESQSNNPPHARRVEELSSAPLLEASSAARGGLSGAAISR